METRTIVILGGYGNTGRALARLLLDHSDVHLVLAGGGARGGGRGARVACPPEDDDRARFHRLPG